MAEYRKLRIFLTADQREALEKATRSGTANAMEIRRANVLLLADESGGRKRMKDVDIARALNVTPQAIHDIKAKFIERSRPEGGEAVSAVSGIERKKRETPPVAPKITGDVEARITAIACSAPPEGRGKWTLRLIAEKAVELQVIDSVSHTQVGRILKKTGLSLI